MMTSQNFKYLTLISSLILGFVLVSGVLEGQCPPGSWVLTGQVVDEAGVGIGGLDLDLINPGTGLSLPLSGDFTLSDGSFTMVVCQVTTPGNYLLHVNPVPSQLFFPLRDVPLTLAGSADLGIFTLDTAAILQGRVVGESFEILPFVDLDFTDSVTGTAQQFSGDFTLADGTFSTKVPPGFWDVQFTASPASTTLDMVPRELRDTLIDGISNLGDVRLRQGRPITGLVVDQVGIPVVNADVDARDLITGEKIVTPGDNTNSSGVFQILVPEGQFELEIDPEAGSTLVPLLLNVVVPVSGLDVGSLILEEGVAVSGLVADGSGAIVPGTDLDFIISATGVEIPTAHDNANSSGQFSVQVVPSTYDIAFRPSFVSGLAPLVVPSVAVTTNINLGTVTLPDGTAFTGTILAGGAPVLEAEIELEDSVSGQPTYLFGNDTDALGAFAVRQVPGVYNLSVTPPPGSGLPSYSENGIDLSTDLNLAIDLLGTQPPTPPNPVESFVCCCPGNVNLQWTLGDADYDLIQILRQGNFLTNLPGDTTSFSDVTAPPGLLEYQVVAIRAGLVSSPAGCILNNSSSQPTAPVENLTCEQLGSGVVINWVNGSANYNFIELYQDGAFVVAMSGGATQIILDVVSVGVHQWELIAVESGVSSTGESCVVDVVSTSGPVFIRGDANLDASVNVADAIEILQYLFNGAPTPDCLSSLDINDSANINIADAILLLGYLFAGGGPPEPPFPDPGVDPTPDALPCN